MRTDCVVNRSTTRPTLRLSLRLASCIRSGNQVLKQLATLSKMPTSSSFPVRVLLTSSTPAKANRRLRDSALNLLHSSSPSHHDSPSLGPCRCPIHTTFSGELRSKVTCGRCHHQSETAEPFLDLSLDLKDRATGLAGKTLGDRLKRCVCAFEQPFRSEALVTGVRD